MATMRLLLIAGILSTVDGCRPDYKTDWFGNCYKTYSQPLNRFRALRTCQRDGATLFPVTSSTDADAFTFISNTLAAMVWIGATCVTENDTSCITDEGIPLSYTSFDTSPPNDYGPCVLFHTYSKIWFSAPCSDTVAPFVCKYTENPYIQYCEPGNWLFNRKCYWSLPPLIPFADPDCQSQDGSMVSVHSIGENGFIHDVIHNSYEMTQDFYRIGLVNNSGKPVWRDGTPYDYNNFDDPCAAVSISGKVVTPGKWFSDTCSVALPTVCKKDASLTHAPSKLMKSALCDGSQLPPEGTIVSPNYPSNYSVHSCSNILIWNSTAHPFLYFSFIETYFTPTDYVKIYRGDELSPTWIITNRHLPGYVDVINSGRLRIDFSGNNTDREKFRWKFVTSFAPMSSIHKGSHSSSWRICNEFSADDPGSGLFSSRNYDRSPTEGGICRTILRAREPGNTIVMTFFDFYLAPYDSVTIYDGYGEVNFAQKYYGVNPGLSYESTGQFVTIVINQTSDFWEYRGVYGEYHSN